MTCIMRMALYLYLEFRDTVSLKEEDSALYQHYATDQAHEQNNKLEKIGGVAIGILDS